MAWAWVGIVVGATAVSDLLQSWQMREHGAIDDFRPGKWPSILAALGRRRYLLLAVFFMAVSFFAFLALLREADLSFAVPATAASYVVEIALAHWLLREPVGAMRWTAAGMVACGVALLAL